MRPVRTWIGIFALLFLAGMGPASHGGLLLADPMRPIASHWQERVFGVPTHYRNLVKDGVPAIEARSEGGASGLYRDVAWPLAEHPVLDWRWRVDELQGAADIRQHGRDDYAAALVLRFGGESFFPWMAPTLVYVWTNDRVDLGDIVPSPRTERVRAIVLRSGEAPLGEWLAERRLVADDFERVFGHAPRSDVTEIGIWSDADQTREPVQAYFAAIRALSP